MIAPRTMIRALVHLLFALISVNAGANPWQELNTPLPENINLGKSNGEKLVLHQPALINFWATWCAPCVQELPDLGRAADQLAPDIQTVLVNVGESPEDIEAFWARHPQISLDHQWTLTQGLGFEEMQALKLRGLPTTLLVVDGVIVGQVEGVKPWHEPEQIRNIRKRALVGQ